MSDRRQLWVEPRSLRLVRWRARLPRQAFLVTCAMLTMLGARTLVAGAPAAPRPAPRPAGGVPQSVLGFAAAFTRAYLSFDARDPARRASALAGFLPGEADDQAGVALPRSGTREVGWTFPVAQRRVARTRVSVTVAAQLTGELRLRFLAVPVTFGPRGMAVADDPAIVGAPPLDAGARSADGGDVEDPALWRIASRATANYVRGASANLAADVLPGRAVPRSPGGLRVIDVAAVTEAGRGRVAVSVLVRDRARVAFTLRYELGVVRRERWFVGSIEMSTTQGGTR